MFYTIQWPLDSWCDFVFMWEIMCIFASIIHWSVWLTQFYLWGSTHGSDGWMVSSISSFPGPVYSIWKQSLHLMGIEVKHLCENVHFCVSTFRFHVLTAILWVSCLYADTAGLQSITAWHPFTHPWPHSGPHLFCPHGIVALLFQRSLQVKVLWVVCRLSAGVANVALCVQALCNLHGVLGTHAWDIKTGLEWFLFFQHTHKTGSCSTITWSY